MNNLLLGSVHRAQLTAFLFCVLAPQFASAADADHARAIDAVFAALRSDHAPGAAVLVVKNGHKVYEGGFGVTDLHMQHKIDAHTNFRLASLTKQFTAMAIMLLVHDGKLQYEDRLTDIFPGFPAYGKAISVRQLLNHTSGLKDYEDLMEAHPRRWSETAQIHDAEVLELLEKQKATKFVPGSHWEYSNSGYVLLGVIVERVSGQPFAQFLHDRIFAPLHMTNTLAYERDKNRVTNRAYGHSRQGRGWIETDQSPTSATLGDGGVYTSLDDLAKWDTALRHHTLLSAADMQPAITPVKVPDNSVKGPNNESAEYGFGWYLNPYKGHVRMWHYGETVGFHTNIQRFADDELTVIVLCNRTDVNPGDMTLKVADLYLH